MVTDEFSLEQEIVANLIANDEFSRKVFPYIVDEYFTSREHRIIFDEFGSYFKKYNRLPTKEALRIELETRSDIDDDTFKDIRGMLNSYYSHVQEAPQDIVWLEQSTEEFCKEQALFNAIRTSIEIIDGEKAGDVSTLPQLLNEALGVSFNESIGHDYFEDMDARWEYYHKEENRIKFMLPWFNTITNGGIPRKTLSAFLAPTNAGKTLVKCHLAADFMSQGYNVLYITMEMAEEKISERIDANLMDVEVNSLKDLDKKTFTTKVKSIAKKIYDKIANKSKGRLFVKEFPTSSAHAGHFRHLLNELRLKKKFVPDVIFIDYLNICGSARIKRYDDSYTLVKTIAEELRGLAVEYDCAIITSTQTNREGWGNSDFDMDVTSESAGLPMTLDNYIGIIVTEQLNEMGQIMFKLLKSRFVDVTDKRYSKCIFGINRPKMKIFECDDPIKFSTPVFNSKKDEEVTYRTPETKKKKTIPFQDFKI